MTPDWSAYAQEQGLGRELGEVLARAARASRSPYLTTGDLLQSLVRDPGHAGVACAALGLGPGRIERPLEELAVSPEPRSEHAPALSIPASDVLFHTQDEGDMLGLQTSGALLLALRLDRRGLPPTPGVPTAPPGHGELVLEMMGIERSRLRMAVLEAISRTHPDARDWDTRCETYLRLSRFHLACTDAQSNARGTGVSPSVQEEAARLPAMALRYLQASPEDLRWLSHALYDGQKKWFVVRLVRMTESLPPALLEPLLCAALFEQDANRNRHFVEAAIRAVGNASVFERLLGYMRQGDDTEKAGAMRALYWCSPPDAAAGREVARGLLDAFQRETDLDVRRSAISNLASISWSTMDPSLQSQMGEVLKLAASHPDVYIRHRADFIRSEAKSVLPAMDRPR
ncbi:hypothetical protein POL68_34645 [Stigmatella sp. ncwal1]|uniref:HEAT repeat domain-containing protein n=1 Tax=Stigmatella ashevillensis TaxID=2995309 RepID=A0ABT5DMS7_9BACT|nr:hypothetical protein [Stigmatella ashevillena]MDC0713657.1 hypothetical protein [Stigmatella ashevillena]